MDRDSSNLSLVETFCLFEGSTHSFARVQAQSCPTLCDLMGCSLPGSSVHGIFQARILGWVAISYSQPRIKPMSLASPALEDRFFHHYTPDKPPSFLWKSLN